MELGKALKKSAQVDNSSTGSEAALALASYWLQRCVSEHENCHVQVPATGIPFVPTRLLDVQGDGVRLIETKKELSGEGADRRYVALSHCWGLIQIIRTLKENYKTHLVQIPANELSKTFSEAIHTVRKLGLRYIWIDSMCIIQDDGDDWGAEAVTMCDVYRNSTLTIYAAHAAGGDVGCFDDRDGILQFPFLLDIPTEHTREEADRSPPQIMFTSYGRGKGLGGPEPPLYGRSWVLQEQLLSPRMLIFDGTQIRWECLTGHGSERSPTGGMSRHAGHQKYIREGIARDHEFFDLPDFEDKVFAARAQNQAWLYTVMDYTHRGMTQPSDRLVAIDGIAQALARRTKNRYLAGLWEGYFWVGLLWSLTHAKEYTGSTDNAFDLDRNERIRHYNKKAQCYEDIAPSWSWVSVTAPTVYPSVANMSMERICEILSASVDGAPAKKTGRAEIRGHVRTGYVNSIYPYAIREAAKVAPNMICGKPTGSKKEDGITWRNKGFHPNDFFIFSEKKVVQPKGTLAKLTAADWKLVRGNWRPDEVLDPNTEITFIAIAQSHKGVKVGSLQETDPMLTWTIGLVPTGKAEGEYRRVGYAEWEDCAWYGYMCGEESRLGRGLENLEEGWRGIVPSNPELYKSKGKGKHKHDFEVDTLPDLTWYEKSIDVNEKVVVVV